MGFIRFFNAILGPLPFLYRIYNLIHKKLIKMYISNVFLIYRLGGVLFIVNIYK
jgi:hypothetical protein